MFDRKLPFSGVECSKDSGTCKIFWQGTHNEKSLSVEVELVVPIKNDAQRQASENFLEKMFNNAFARTQGCD